MMISISTGGKQVTKTVLYGLGGLLLYSLLYLFEDDIMEVATHGEWYFVVPVVIAFAFSFVHGKFTSRFWDTLGIKAKQ